ncbi:MAG: DUF1993 family protein [Rhizobiales bacterium]|nr:DUF1993 family protein [Hyphomicrobiales bacterium]
MTLSMYQASIPVMLQMFGSVAGLLDKAVAHCEAHKIDPQVMLNYRLAADMHPLTRQIQIMSDQAKLASARLAGVDAPPFPDEEASFEELKARIHKTVAFLKTLTPAQIDGTEDKAITLKFPGMELNLTGQQYLMHFFMPNFFFHASTAYNIMRHAGVVIGKRDFVGAF